MCFTLNLRLDKLTVPLFFLYININELDEMAGPEQEEILASGTENCSLGEASDVELRCFNAPGAIKVQVA